MLSSLLKMPTLCEMNIFQSMKFHFCTESESTHIHFELNWILFPFWTIFCNRMYLHQQIKPWTSKHKFMWDPFRAHKNINLCKIPLELKKHKFMWDPIRAHKNKFMWDPLHFNKPTMSIGENTALSRTNWETV